MTAGLAYDTRCLIHDNGSMVLDETAASWIEVPHAENAARVERAHQVLTASGVAARLTPIAARTATWEELGVVHSEQHIAAIERACSGSATSWVGPEARVGPGTWDAALISAGSALACVDHALTTPERRAYCLTRPPGHHASRDRAMGFCLFNNAALAARHAQRAHGLGRIAIIDWDVHHGNGTQEVFYDDPNVLFVSVHQEAFYPADMGTLGERGAGDGVGANLNVPMPPGSGDAAYVAAISELVVPALADFDPELIIVSSGQDAAASDPLGRMSLSTEGFAGMTQKIVEFAESPASRARGRVVAVQEGGYSIDHMPFCVLATVEALAGLESVLTGDPMELDLPGEMNVAERKAIDDAKLAWTEKAA